MTIATDSGFKIGALYRVITEVNSNIYAKDMIVRFEEDDGTTRPYFSFHSGPKAHDTDEYDVFCVTLGHLKPFDDCKQSTNKSLLILYINQQYPDDKVLKALVEFL